MITIAKHIVNGVKYRIMKEQRTKQYFLTVDRKIVFSTRDLDIAGRALNLLPYCVFDIELLESGYNRKA